MITRLRSGAGKRRDYAAMAGKRAGKSKLAPKVRKAVARIAKAVVRRNVEDKYVSVSLNSTFNSSISAPSECYPVIPQVPIGNGDFQRIGSKITPKYLVVKGYIQYDQAYLNTVGATSYIPPATCRAMILSQKNVKSGGMVAAQIDVNHLLKDNVNTGAARPYGGGLLDNLAPVNKDLFRVHMDKKIKFNWVNHMSYPGGGNSTDTLAAGNDRTKYFRVRIKLPKTLTFDEGNGDWPNNVAPFFCFGAVCDDNSAKWTNAPFRVNWISTLYFEDA